MLLKKLIINTPFTYHKKKISGLSIDSRDVKKNNLFFSLEKNKIKRDKYIKDALKKGAIVITSYKYILKENVIRVDKKKITTLLAYACQKFFRKKPKNIIAVTGTNGKSSVADIFRQLLCLNHVPVASIGTLGIYINSKKKESNLTTPDIITLHKTLQKIKKKGIENVIIETSSHGLKQGRLNGIYFNIGIFTNFSRDHLDYHKSIKEYFNSKMLLLNSHMKKNKYFLVENDIPEIKKIKKILKKNRLRLFNLENFKRKIGKINNKNFFTDFQYSNIFFAAGAAQLIGLPVKKIKEKIKILKPVMGRLEKIKTLKNKSEIFIDYAHTPDALNKKKKNLKSSNQKITLLFGCGGQRDKGKRSIMGKIANRYCDKIYITDDNPRFENPKKIRKSIAKSIDKKKYIEVDDRTKAITDSIYSSMPKERILIAGKGHETVQDYGSYSYNISDKEIVLKAKEKDTSTQEKINKEIFEKVLSKKTKKGFKRLIIDSKIAKRGDLFVAIKGQYKDGHNYIKESFLKGCIGAVTSKKIKSSKKTYKVKNTLSFLNSFGSLKRDNSNSMFIGITGSSGKTTVKTILAKILSLYGNTYFSPKSYNNHIGVPLSLSNIDLTSDFCVFEIGMSKKNEINSLSKLIKPHIGIITNIGEAHLENFDSIKGIADAKSEIITNIVDGGTLILNRDDKFFDYLLKKANYKKLNIISFGTNSNADIYIKKISGKKVYIKVLTETYIFEINNKTQNILMSFLCCISVLKTLNLDLKKISKINHLLYNIEGRGKIHKVKRYNKVFNLIDESYNANPSSTKNAIKNFSEIKTNGKKYFIFGDMLELGKKTHFFHKDISKFINNSKVDKTFTFGKKTLTTYKYLNKKKKGNVFQNLGDFDLIMKDLLKHDDYLMIKGSNASNVKKFSKALIGGYKNVI